MLWTGPRNGRPSVSGARQMKLNMKGERREQPNHLVESADAFRGLEWHVLA